MSTWPAGVTPTSDYEAALDFVQTGEGHLFITGRAGTGKSTLLRVLCDAVDERPVVVAPTGLAAVNVGGQTIHSFFGLPPRLIRVDDIKRSRNGRVMRQMSTLVIDEVSMVRADLMWAIDQTLRLNRNKPLEPFGGVRLILFGDLHQLPPVIRDHEEAAHLENAYGGAFFFSISALQEGIGTQLLELGQVFRQTDEALVRVLDRVREGEVDEEDLELLNEQVSPIRTLREGQDYVILTPTNDAANRINRAYLDALPEELHRFNANVSGEFNPRAQPAEAELALKVGARVIMLRNDSERRWVNGSIAKVSRLEAERVWIEIDGKEHEVEPVAWENRRYAFEQEKNKIVETVAGTFQQFPLRLAWALTIHKSQGLTLDNVYIDLGRGTFAHGQAYVALSRCRSLEGLTLARPLQPRDILFDPEATAYRRVFPSLV